MAARKIVDDVYFVGAIDWIRTIFDELIPLPHGTSYNSYIIKGSEKTALIDTVEPIEFNQLNDNIKKLNIKNIDYIISNHAEQDHSGSIPKVLELFPQAKVVTNKKCKDMLVDHLLIKEDKFIIINDDEILSLGNKSLKFIIAPWVHWPETMFTYLVEDKILFSGDFLGAHIASSDLFATDLCIAYDAAKRYYAEIMMPFRHFIKKHLKRINELEIKYIAPSHGMIHNKPEFIINAYSDWVSDNVKDEVVIPYVSMHGTTRDMVAHLINSLMDRGISVKPYNLLQTDIGDLAISAVDAATIVIGTSTVLGGPHPHVVFASSIINALKPKTKYLSIIGSYGWGGNTIKALKSMLTNVKGEFIEPVKIKGYPTQEDFSTIDRLADDIEKRHKNLNLI